MTQAPVGFHCPECLAKGRQQVRTMRDVLARRPIATQTLIALNALAFVASLLAGDSLNGQPSNTGLIARGALFGPLIHVHGELWRIVTSGFLHFGAVHLAMNMYALWILGPELERALGWLRFTLVYLAALTCGSLGAMLLTPLAWTAGASGAIFGLFGILLVAVQASGQSIWNSSLGPVLVINLVLTVAIPGVSVGGHGGGFLAGLACGWVICSLPRRLLQRRGLPEALFAGLAILGFVGAWLASAGWVHASK